MPDITMCTNKECPHANDCYRFKARPSEYRQAYACFKPEENGNCEHFIKLWVS